MIVTSRLRPRSLLAWMQAADLRLPLATGLRDSHVRRQPTSRWEVWREEAPWMTLYFSVGVWTSLAMVLLESAASSR